MTTATWVGSKLGYGNLDDPTNWSTGVVPGKGDTAVFAANISVDMLNLGRGQFAASTIDINRGVTVNFNGNNAGTAAQQPINYNIQTLNISQAAVAHFTTGSSLVAQTVNDAGWLDMLHSSVVGASSPNPFFTGMLAFTNPLVNGEFWSFLHGFGWTDLGGVVGNLNLLANNIWHDANMGMEGSITPGENNLAVENLNPVYKVTTDQYDFMREGPSMPYGSTQGLVDVANSSVPVSQANQLGYVGPIAYTSLFTHTFG